MCAAEDWKEDELFALARRSYPYRELPRADFDAVVEMLSEALPRAADVTGRTCTRPRERALHARRGSRLAASPAGRNPDNRCTP